MNEHIGVGEIASTEGGKRRLPKARSPFRLGGPTRFLTFHAEWSTFSALVNLIFLTIKSKNSTQTFSFLTIKSKNSRSTQTFSIYEKRLTGNLYSSGEAKSFGVNQSINQSINQSKRMAMPFYWNALKDM